MEAGRPEMTWRKIIGLRNLLAHGYWSIDVEECNSASAIFDRPMKRPCSRSM
jgi:uncharacterized protein with HEPN domain